MNLSVNIGPLKFNNPVTVASGTFRFDEKFYDVKELKKLGALVFKTVTLHPRVGNPPPRIIETASGMINAVGIENSGGDAFIEELVLLKKISIPLIISITGENDKEFAILAEKFNDVKEVSALELNLSCPNLKKSKLVSQDPKATFRIVKMIKRVSRVPIIAKLSPNVTDISTIALAAQDAGVDAVSLINTLTAMVIDVKTKRSILGNVKGGLSGPAIKPIAIRMVYEVAKKVNIPIIGMGGISTVNDALEFLIAGATMIAVGSMNFINPRCPWDIIDGIRDYMKKNKICDIHDIIGSVDS